MAPIEILRELEGLARRLGIVVRYDAFEPKVTAGKGGLCRLRGKAILVVDGALPPLDKVAVLEAALSTLDLEGIYVPPLVRARLERRAPRMSLSRPPLRKCARTHG